MLMEIVQLTERRMQNADKTRINKFLKYVIFISFVAAEDKK